MIYLSIFGILTGIFNMTICIAEMDKKERQSWYPFMLALSLTLVFIGELIEALHK